MPTATATKMTVTVQDYAYVFTGNRSEPIQYTYNVKPMQPKKTYTLPITIKSDLIFTEVYHPSDIGNVIEFYNPTTSPIRLKDYYIVSMTHDGQERYYTQLGKLFNNGSQVLTQSFGDVWYEAAGYDGDSKDAAGDYILQPGRTCVYHPTAAAFPSGGYSYPGRLAPNGGGKTLNHVLRYWGEKSSGNNSPRAFWANTGYGYAIMKTDNIAADLYNDNKIVDVFFKTNDGNYLTYNAVSYLRRPDRNFPRKYMIGAEKDANSDWVYYSYDLRDMGYRYQNYWPSYQSYENVITGRNLIDTQGRDRNSNPIGTYYAVFLAGGAVSTNAYIFPWWWNASNWH